MAFIHHQVRLNASMTQSMRFFLIEKEIEKWFGSVVTIENKKNGRYHLNFTYQEVNWTSDSIILEKDFERRLKFDMITPEAFRTEVELFFMPCTHKTEYCTEIHLVHKNVPENEHDFILGFWHEKFNNIRTYFNKDWIIEDRDLVLSVLKGSF